MLQISNLNAWYGASHVLQDVSIEVAKGEIVCLIGRNGAGKTTTLKSIMGLMDRTRGSAIFKDKELLSQPAHVRFALGLAYVPEERRIVQGLSVRENLRLGLVASPEKKREVELIEGIAQIFPRLAERLDQEAVTMSGGEQQMLAIARAMIANPDLIMLDEPSEGIMPVLVDEMFELFRSMKAQGTTILLVEQNVELALDIADRAYVLDQGAVVYHAAASELLADNDIITPPRVSSWPITISRNAIALCDLAHRLPFNIREQVFQPRALCAPRVCSSGYSLRQEGYRRPHRLLLSNRRERNDKVLRSSE